MRVAERFRNSQGLMNLPITQEALYLLAGPTVLEEAREEAVERAGTKKSPGAMHRPGSGGEERPSARLHGGPPDAVQCARHRAAGCSTRGSRRWRPRSPTRTRRRPADARMVLRQNHSRRSANLVCPTPARCCATATSNGGGLTQRCQDIGLSEVIESRRLAQKLSDFRTAHSGQKIG
jgi:hypothetical protein